MSDEIKIVEEVQMRKVQYVVDGVLHEDEIEVATEKHLRPDGTIKHLIIKPSPIHIKSDAQNTGESQ